MRAESPPAPPKIAAPSTFAFFTAAILVATILGSGAVLFFFDPAQHGFYPICLFHALTRLNCPGCGATRAAYQLLHGHLLRALQDNALFVLTLAGLTARSAWWVGQKIRRRPAVVALPSAALWTFLVGVLFFTVLRNLPGFAWLSP
jgi:hypothetical protein